MKRHFGKWLTAAALAVGCTVMTANAFADTNGHWAESAINKWSGEYGIIQGYDDGTFRPDKSLSLIHISCPAADRRLLRFRHHLCRLSQRPDRRPEGQPDVYKRQIFHSLMCRRST